MSSTSQRFAHSMTPLQREYLGHLIAEQVAPLTVKIAELEDQLATANRAHRAAAQALRDEVEVLKTHHAEDTRYALTRAKLIAFMRDQGYLQEGGA